MQVEDHVDLVHTGPGTLAGRYLRTFWQPVYRASDLAPGRALPIRILGEDLTLYRGESSTPHLVASGCAHRGTQLSTGWVEGDCLRCRYHGWRYDGTGQCVEQPGEVDSFAAKVRITSYPTEEYLGLIFAYLGEAPPPPLRHYPDFEGPGVLEVDPPEVWPCNFFNRLDNACDLAHVAFTHRATALRMNQGGRLAVRSVSAEETEYGIRTTSSVPDSLSQHTDLHMPNVNQLRVRVRVPGYEHLWEHRLVCRMPIDDEWHVSFDVNLVAGLVGDAAERFRQQRRELQETETSSPYEAAEAILAGKMRIEDVDRNLSLYKQFWIEDYVIMVGQGRIADRAHEHLGRSDVGLLLNRRIWYRELRALAEGRPLKQWTSPALYPPG
jgi:5,5'-dehydrodivanillate O-demethylase oxygenase subunit